jgi:DNA-binding Lrp family transcriptional regulator
MNNSKRRTEEYRADKIDKKILNLLGQDSSLNAVEIAEKLELTLDVVRYRIKNLSKENVIIKFFPEISLPKLGYTEYLYVLKLRNLSLEKFNELKDTIKFNDNITYAFVDKNSYYIVFDCAFSSPGGIDSLSRSLRERFSDIVESHDYLIIKEQIHFNLFPKGLINL